MIEIRRLTPDTAPLLWTVEDRRLDSEQVVVRPGQNGFALAYKPMPNALWRLGNAQRDIEGTAEDWIDREERCIYLAWLGDKLAGQMAVDMGECGLARVRDIRVGMAERRRGVGSALLDMADSWAKSRNLSGLVAETQDSNAGACQFLARCGFALGGVDTLRYTVRAQKANTPMALRESALFFYRFLKGN